MKELNTIICGPRLYRYGKWTFEVHAWCGPSWPLRKDGELRKRAGRVFYAMFERWEAEPDREKYRIGGGCQVS